MTSRLEHKARNGSTPTVLLVHDAFADTSMWAATMAACRRAGTDCLAVANPLRGLGADAGYVAATVATIDGPVLLVGHGYGAAVACVAAAATTNVTALACVAGFTPDIGEGCVELLGWGASTEFLAALRPRRIRVDGAELTELSIDGDLYPEVAAADLPDDQARILAACQRPVSARALEERATAAAWREVRMWYLVAAADRLLPPDIQRALAHRAGATTFEADASHSVAVSRPDAVASLIAAAIAG
jgi:pimeloyl-ACP methyl ester carboxylesterase